MVCARRRYVFDVRPVWQSFTSKSFLLFASCMHLWVRILTPGSAHSPESLLCIAMNCSCGFPDSDDVIFLPLSSLFHLYYIWHNLHAILTKEYVTYLQTTEKNNDTIPGHNRICRMIRPPSTKGATQTYPCSAYRISESRARNKIIVKIHLLTTDSHRSFSFWINNSLLCCTFTSFWLIWESNVNTRNGIFT